MALESALLRAVGIAWAKVVVVVVVVAVVMVGAVRVLGRG
jgi:hypothetical protein